MSPSSVNRRLIGSVLAGALVLGTFGPAAAQRMPISGDFVQPLVEEVAVRRKRRGNNNQALGAAVLLGAAALGIAAIASQNRKRDRGYYYAQPQHGYHPGYGYGHGYHQPQVYHAPAYRQPRVYHQQGYYQPTQHYRQPQVYHAPRQYVPYGAPPGGYNDGQGGYVYRGRGGSVNRVIIDRPANSGPGIPAPFEQVR